MSGIVPSSGRELRKSELQAYERDGYLILRDFVPEAWITRLTADAERLLRRLDIIRSRNLRCRWQWNVMKQQIVFDALDPVVDISEVCCALSEDELIVGLLRSIYGEEPRLFRDKLIFKQPGSQGYELHQDYVPGTEFPASYVTVVVAIDEANLENGCVEVLRGYHHGSYLADDLETNPAIPEGVVDVSKVVALQLEPGDVAVFPARTPHRSGPNRSQGWRRLLYLSYNAASDGGSRRSRHYAEYHQRLRERFAAEGKRDMFFL